jgi:hypothetical protein
VGSEGASTEREREREKGGAEGRSAAQWNSEFGNRTGQTTAAGTGGVRWWERGGARVAVAEGKYGGAGVSGARG